MKKVIFSSLLAVTLVSCGRDITKSDVRMVNVGMNPDEIGPAPSEYGGYLDYYWLDFAGGGLNMAMSGLYVGYADLAVGFQMGFHPPFALVAGFSYLFDTKLAGVDKLGVVPDPPNAPDVCHTLIRPQGPIGYFNTTDAGAAIVLQGTEQETSDYQFILSRDPAEYPPDPQDAMSVYLGATPWVSQPLYAYKATGSDDPYSMERKPAKYANFPFGRQMSLSFPGGLAPFPAPVASMPLPSSYAGSPTIWVPNQQPGIRLAWEGPRYDSTGAIVGTGPNATCFNFYWPSDAKSAPATAADCAVPIQYSQGSSLDPNVYPGQIYTGPWDTDKGELSFEWATPANVADTGEQVSITVKFLGPVDRQYNEYIRSRMVNYEDPAKPSLGRASMACEPGTWVLEPSYYADPTKPDEGAPLAASLWGDPLDVVSEVSCNVSDDGQFTLTEAQVKEAVDYAKKVGAEGAIFYFTRSTKTEGVVPDVKDIYDNRKEVSPILINARTVELGRFVFNGE